VQPDGIVTFGFVALAVNFHPDFKLIPLPLPGREDVENQDTYVVASLNARTWRGKRQASVPRPERNRLLAGYRLDRSGKVQDVRLRTDIEHRN